MEEVLVEENVEESNLVKSEELSNIKQTIASEVFPFIKWLEEWKVNKNISFWNRVIEVIDVKSVIIFWDNGGLKMILLKSNNVLLLDGDDNFLCDISNLSFIKSNNNLLLFWESDWKWNMGYKIFNWKTFVNFSWTNKFKNLPTILENRIILKNSDWYKVLINKNWKNIFWEGIFYKYISLVKEWIYIVKNEDWTHSLINENNKIINWLEKFTNIIYLSKKSVILYREKDWDEYKRIWFDDLGNR